MSTASMPSSVIERFEAIHWHDSKLTGLAVQRRSGTDEVVLFVTLPTLESAPVSATLKFAHSTYLEVRLDLEAKRLCADDVSDGRCFSSSDWLGALAEANPYDSFAGFLHFQLDLIPPGGWIRLLAKDFELQTP